MFLPWSHSGAVPYNLFLILSAVDVILFGAPCVRSMALNIGAVAEFLGSWAQREFRQPRDLEFPRMVVAFFVVAVLIVCGFGNWIFGAPGALHWIPVAFLLLVPVALAFDIAALRRKARSGGPSDDDVADSGAYVIHIANEFGVVVDTRRVSGTSGSGGTDKTRRLASSSAFLDRFRRMLRRGQA